MGTVQLGMLAIVIAGILVIFGGVVPQLRSFAWRALAVGMLLIAAAGVFTPHITAPEAADVTAR